MVGVRPWIQCQQKFLEFIIPSPRSRCAKNILFTVNLNFTNITSLLALELLYFPDTGKSKIKIKKFKNIFEFKTKDRTTGPQKKIRNSQNFKIQVASDGISSARCSNENKKDDCANFYLNTRYLVRTWTIVNGYKILANLPYHVNFDTRVLTKWSR